MSNNIDKNNEILGVVDEALPNTLFRVTVKESGDQILAYLAGKLRLNRIRVLVGDEVLLLVHPMGGKAKIIRRM